jgi:hypothetical protein
MSSWANASALSPWRRAKTSACRPTASGFGAAFPRVFVKKADCEAKPPLGGANPGNGAPLLVNPRRANHSLNGERLMAVAGLERLAIAKALGTCVRPTLYPLSKSMTRRGCASMELCAEGAA